ncbi:MAG: SPFH domain-containing protein [Phycisphaerales bacterium]|nr:SPFH domain-containing protein [Phycisphaerales bacterium]
MSEETPSDSIDPVREEDGVIDEAPRREKSAEFTVVADPASEADLRDAMDPANQSLTEALRLSYRVLQFSILALAVVFIFSGFQTVRENRTGIRTLFGAIEGEGADAQISAGLQPFWPYPVGEIVTVPLKRTVSVEQSFWPNFGARTLTLEEATAGAQSNRPLRPGPVGKGDGTLILEGGDLAHCRMTGEYSIEDAVSFLVRFTPEQGDEVVKLMLEQAAIHTAATMTLAQFVDGDEAALEIKRRAQESLNTLQSGIRLVAISVTDRIPPLTVRKNMQNVQGARERAKIAVEVARRESTTILDGAAGASALADLISLIGDYESALSGGDEVEGEAVLARIGARFEAPDIGGQAAKIMTEARAFRSMIEAGIGNDARRLASLVPAFAENPQQLVRQLWLDAYRDVLNGPEVEVISAPPGLRGLALRMKSSMDITTRRRDASTDRRRMESMQGGIDGNAWQLGSRQISIDKAGRRLNKDATGGFGREGAGE